MNTEPTDAEINEGIAKFCGWIHCTCGYPGCSAWKNGVAHFTSSFDALRQAIGKMNGQQQGELLRALYDPCAGRGPAWLLCDAPARALAEAVYQVVKGESK